MKLFENISSDTTQQYGNDIRLISTDSRNVLIQETGESRATRFTFSFLHSLLLLPHIMDYMCEVGVVPNTNTTITDTKQTKKKREAQVRICMVVREERRGEGGIRRNSESLVRRREGEYKVITIPVTASTAVCAVILDFWSNRAKLFPRGSWEGIGQPPLS